MTRLRLVRCVDNRPFLLAADGRLVQVMRPGKLLSLTIGMVYEVVSMERGWYRIIDDLGEDYLYPPELFEVLPEVS